MHEPELEQYLEQCRQLVARETYMININDKGLVPYAYTVGLTHLMDFELVAVGQDAQASRIVLDEMASHLLMCGGSVPDGEILLAENCTNLKLVPLPMDEKLARMFSLLPALGYAPARMRQVLVSNADSVFPDSIGYRGAIQSLDCCLSRRPSELH